MSMIFLCFAGRLCRKTHAFRNDYGNLFGVLNLNAR